MSSVWIVTAGEYSDYHFVGVFSTKEKAEEYSKTHRKGYNSDREDFDPAEETHISECEVDNLEGAIWTTPFYAIIALEPSTLIGIETEEHVEAGEIYGQGEDMYCVAHNPSERGYVEYRFYKGKYPLSIAHAYSYISQEHANKLAIEAYQSYLRNKIVEDWDYVDYEKEE